MKDNILLLIAVGSMFISVEYSLCNAMGKTFLFAFIAIVASIKYLVNFSKRK